MSVHLLKKKKINSNTHKHAKNYVHGIWRFYVCGQKFTI